MRVPVAIAADAEFAAAYGNLARLYYRHGLAAGAERLLQHAIALKDTTDAPLRAMHQLLLDQGRIAEAQHYAALLAQRQTEDPYYWLGVGLDHLQRSRYRQAIDSLERAQALASGFVEIHRYLALAYWRDGQQTAATRQLSLLAAIAGDDPEIETLSRKFQGAGQLRNAQ